MFLLFPPAFGANLKCSGMVPKAFESCCLLSPIAFPWTIFHLLFLKATKVLLIPGPSHWLSPLPLSKHWASVEMTPVEIGPH